MICLHALHRNCLLINKQDAHQDMSHGTAGLTHTWVVALLALMHSPQLSMFKGRIDMEIQCQGALVL